MSLLGPPGYLAGIGASVYAELRDLKIASLVQSAVVASGGDPGTLGEQV
jgi:hypothetical protein